MEIKEKILFKSLVGSKLYGTDNESSDTDIKGVFLPKITDLILNKAPKHFTSSTGSNSTHNSKDDIDETYLSLQYFLELAAKGETNALDIIFAYTNSKAVLYQDPIWNVLIKNLDKIITKNVNSYLGYCKSQCVKYSIKGDKLSAYNALKDFLEDLINKKVKNKDGAWIDLGTALREFKEYKVGIYSDYEKKGKLIGKRAPIAENVSNKPLFGDHCYICVMNNDEIFLMVSDANFNFNESIVDTLHKVQRTIDSYGKRAEIAMENSGADFKAISHCVRVLFQTEDLLTTGKVHFPLKEAEFIKSIKLNTTSMSREEIMDLINTKIEYIDTVLLPKSNLREKADYNWINNFILSCYDFEEYDYI